MSGLFDDIDDNSAHVPTNVLAVALPFDSSEALTARAMICRDDDYAAARMVIFCDGDENGNLFLNAKQFQAAMNWPREPSMDEAMAWLIEKRDAVDARAAAHQSASP